MKRLILTINFCILILSVFSQAMTNYSASFLQPGYPSTIKNINKIIDGGMHGYKYTMESSRLETGIDTLTGYFGVIKIEARTEPLYTVFIANRDSLLSGQLGIILSKDTLNYLKTDMDLGLSQYSKDKIHLSLKYNQDSNTVLYKWGNGIGNDIGKPIIIKDNVFKVGNEFPPLEIKLLGGSQIAVKDFKNKIVVINWWHTHCGPYIAEMPGLNDLVDLYGKRDDILFLSIADNTENELKDFLKKREFKYKQGIRTETTKQILEAGYPQHIIMSKDGKIAFFTAGGGENRAADIKREIEKLINHLQVNDKLFIEYNGEFNLMSGHINKIEKIELNTSININSKNKDQQMVFKNSAINESFLSYIENGDLMDLKIVDNEKRVAIFKKQKRVCKK